MMKAEHLREPQPEKAAPIGNESSERGAIREWKSYHGPGKDL